MKIMAGLRLRCLMQVLLAAVLFLSAVVMVYADTAAPVDKLVQCSSSGTVTNDTAISGVNLPVVFDSNPDYYPVSVDAAVYSGSTLVRGLYSLACTNVNISLGSASNYSPNTVYEIKYRGHYGIVGEGDQEITENWKSSGLYFCVASQSVVTDKAAADKAALTWDTIRGTNTLQEGVTANLNLSVTGAVYGSAITWISGNTAVISNSGTVTRPAYAEGDANVTVSAAVYNDGVTDTKSFSLVVLKLSSTTSAGSDGSSGGGSSGGGSSANNATPANPSITVSTNAGTSSPGATSTATVAAKSDSNGKATAAVTGSQISEAVSKALEAVAQQGEDIAARVEIKVSAPAEAKTVETSLPKAAVAALADSKAAALTVATPVAAITFDKAAINTIAKEAADDVKITASKVDAAGLSDTAKVVVGDRPVFNFSVTSGDKTISQLGGDVTVAVPYTPKAGEDTNAIVIYYINAEGKAEMVSNCAYDPAAGTIKFTTNHFSIYAVGYNKVSFNDVLAAAWYSSAVTFLAARDITTGTGDGNYSPENKLTRGQFLVMVMRAYGMKADVNPQENFTDSGNTYYTGYLAAAKRLGISDGIGNNLFAPEKEITRQEMFTLLYSALMSAGELPEGNSGKQLSDFSDADQVASWAKDAMTWLVKTGTISGSAGRLTPTSTTSRAEMATVLYNLLSK